MKKDATKPTSASPLPRRQAAAMEIVARCLGLPRVSVAAARYMVMEAARQPTQGAPRPEVARLRLDLERETGCPIAELAEDARTWPGAPPASAPA